MYISDLTPGDQVVINGALYVFKGIKYHENKKCYAFTARQNGEVFEKFFLVGKSAIETNKFKRNERGQPEW